MLIPRFSIRALFVFTTISAGFALILRFAAQGQAWAVGISWAVASLALLFVFLGFSFLVAYWIAEMRRTMGPGQTASSPFAASGPPKQLVPPREPE